MRETIVQTYPGPFEISDSSSSSVADADGTIVLTAKDPMIANWIATKLNEGADWSKNNLEITSEEFFITVEDAA